MLRSLVLGAIVLCSSLSFATDISGRWVGHLQVLLTSNDSKTDKTEVDRMNAMYEKAPAKLLIRKDGSYYLEVFQYEERHNDSSGSESLKVKPQTEEGTWSIKGDQISFKALKSNGITDSSGESHPLTISKNGKSLSFTSPDHSAVINFQRPPVQAKPSNSKGATTPDESAAVQSQK